MDNSDGDGDGLGYVSIEAFTQYRSDQTSLCKAYRSHLDTKITSMERNIRWSIYLTGAVITILLSLLNWFIAMRGI